MGYVDFKEEKYKAQIQLKKEEKTIKKYLMN